MALVAPPPRPAGLSNRDPNPHGRSLADLGPKPEAILFKGEYYHSKGASIRTPGGGWAMPMLDAFKVLEVVEAPPAIRDGLVPSSIQVRSGDSVLPPSGKPQVGQVHSMRLRPDDETWNKIAEDRREGVAFMVVGARELMITSGPDEPLPRESPSRDGQRLVHPERAVRFRAILSRCDDGIPDPCHNLVLQVLDPVLNYGYDESVRCL